MIPSMMVTMAARDAHLFSANSPAVDIAAGVLLASGCYSIIAGIRLLLKLPECGCEDLVMKRRR